jgi:hypothetical protein
MGNTPRGSTSVIPRDRASPRCLKSAPLVLTEVLLPVLVPVVGPLLVVLIAIVRSGGVGQQQQQRKEGEKSIYAFSRIIPSRSAPLVLPPLVLLNAYIDFSP